VKRRGFLKNLLAVGVTAGVGAGLALKSGSGHTSGIGLRPPGALPEEEFLSRCIRCFRCGDACPNRAIVALNEVTGREFSRVPGPGEAGTPVIFPRRQACILCAGVAGDELLCTAACPTGALEKVEKTREAIQAAVHMGTATLDKNICYSWNGSSCGVCVRACPFEGKALKAGFFERPVINPDACVGCGTCERACIRYPQAIRIERSQA
jgi:MauM/NapG family ferredoxin protein